MNPSNLEQTFLLQEKLLDYLKDKFMGVRGEPTQFEPSGYTDFTHNRDARQYSGRSSYHDYDDYGYTPSSQRLPVDTEPTGNAVDYKKLARAMSDYQRGISDDDDIPLQNIQQPKIPTKNQSSYWQSTLDPEGTDSQKARAAKTLDFLKIKPSVNTPEKIIPSESGGYSFVKQSAQPVVQPNVQNIKNPWSSEVTGPNPFVKSGKTAAPSKPVQIQATSTADNASDLIKSLIPPSNVPATSVDTSMLPKPPVRSIDVKQKSRMPVPSVAIRTGGIAAKKPVQPSNRLQQRGISKPSLMKNRQSILQRPPSTTPTKEMATIQTGAISNKTEPKVKPAPPLQALALPKPKVQTKEKLKTVPKPLVTHKEVYMNNTTPLNEWEYLRYFIEKTEIPVEPKSKSKKTWYKTPKRLLKEKPMDSDYLEPHAKKFDDYEVCGHRVDPMIKGKPVLFSWDAEY